MLDSAEVIHGRKDGGKVWVGDRELRPADSAKVRNHSPGGFTWGNCGPGASQLALAVMLRFLPPEEAILVYQDFKHAFVHNWSGDFSAPVADIAAWVAKKQSGIKALKESQKTRGKPVPKQKTEQPPAQRMQEAA